MKYSTDELTQLIVKYGGNYPRYTSYPTVLELKPCTNTEMIYQLFNRSQKLSLYIHIPFCQSICSFCACNRFLAQHNDKQHYLESLRKEAILLSKQNNIISSIHLGGGSPSYLEVADLKFLNSIINTNFNILSNCQRSIELDPRTLTKNKTQSLASMGFTRASIGVQDFTPEVQKAIGRIQSYDLTANSINELRQASFNSINIDLIYGLPKQSLSTFTASIEKVITLKPERIALYGFANVPWKAKNQQILQELPRPAPLERLQLFIQALQLLQQAGYEYIGLDHFALPTDELAQARRTNSLHRNFMGYTSDQTEGVLAIGASSISDLSGTLYQNFTQLPEYLDKLDKNELPVAKYYSRNKIDTIRSKIIEAIMCNDTVLFNKFKNEDYAKEIITDFTGKLQPFIEDELVFVSPTSLTITPYGRFFVRQIAATLDTFLSKYKQEQKPCFSQGT